MVAGALGGGKDPAFTECLGAKNDVSYFIIYFNHHKEITLSPFSRGERQGPALLCDVLSIVSLSHGEVDFKLVYLTLPKFFPAHHTDPGQDHFHVLEVLSLNLSAEISWLVLTCSGPC